MKIKDKDKWEVWVLVFKTHEQAKRYVEEGKLSNSQTIIKFKGKGYMGKAFDFMEEEVEKDPNADIIFEFPNNSPNQARGAWFSPCFETDNNPWGLQMTSWE